MMLLVTGFGGPQPHHFLPSLCSLPGLEGRLDRLQILHCGYSNSSLLEREARRHGIRFRKLGPDQLPAMSAGPKLWADAIHAGLKDIRPTSIFTMAETLVLPTAIVAEDLGIEESPSFEGARNARSKIRMRECWQGKDWSLKFAEVTSQDSLEKAANSIGFPLILKMAAGVGGLAAEVLWSRDTVEGAYDRAKAKVMRGMARLPDICQGFAEDDRFIVEEFVATDNLETASQWPSELPQRAPYFSVEGIVFKRQFFPVAITDRYPRRAGCVESGAVTPSRLNPDLQSQAIHITNDAVGLLGLRTCAIHAELIIDSSGNLRMLEIAARTGGVSTFAPGPLVSYGIDAMRLLGMAHMGQRPTSAMTPATMLPEATEAVATLVLSPFEICRDRPRPPVFGGLMVPSPPTGVTCWMKEGSLARGDAFPTPETLMGGIWEMVLLAYAQGPQNLVEQFAVQLREDTDWQ
jgi:hypothetical protein